jgi:hypothetical protein
MSNSYCHLGRAGGTPLEISSPPCGWEVARNCPHTETPPFHGPMLSRKPGEAKGGRVCRWVGAPIRWAREGERDPSRDCKPRLPRPANAGLRPRPLLGLPVARRARTPLTTYHLTTCRFHFFPTRSPKAALPPLQAPLDCAYHRRVRRCAAAWGEDGTIEPSCPGFRGLRKHESWRATSDVRPDQIGP